MPRTYTRTCNCLRCKKCRDRERKRLLYRMRKAGAETSLVDPTEAAEHVRTLLEAGVGYDSIERAANVGHATVWRIAHGQGKQITREVRDALLGVTVRDALHRNPVGTRRRIQALCALGWTTAEQAAVIGVRQSDIAYWMSPKRTWVMPETDRLVRLLYDKLSMTLGPSDQSRRLAAKKRWAPPLAWDDDTIDDPDAKPHMPRGEHRGNPGADLPPIEQIAAEVNRGSVKAVAAHYRVHTRTIERRLAAAGYRARQVGAYTYVYVKEDAA